MMTYEQRITLFIDILGFRNIVTQTETDEVYTDKIFSVLDSMKSEILSNELFAEINITEVNKEELERIKELQVRLSHELKNESSIRITHFSDSIVMSIGLDSNMYVMSLIEYVCRLSYRLWRDFKILIRGGVSVDKLIHKENGALFGPAMVKAYDYETNLAEYPRVVFDDLSYNIFRKSSLYGAMEKMIKPFSSKRENAGKIIEIKNGFEINLGTSILHLLTSHFTFHPDKRKEVLEVLKNLHTDLNEIYDTIKSEKVKSKYKYLIDEINRIEYPKI
ncbi:hypothetical protein [Xanthocytophaga flava]|uniref:hypothetical protein n=1 Tax=Xanthocytophaga flava TaxID=3048013 RepID=UPI0028D064BD|nr:hypothetical protein [Xanthocytophaga flavus]MDJ1470350.1 hypothetical protein [Xanthocytophaga flavus]